MFHEIGRSCQLKKDRATVICDKNFWKCVCLCAVISVFSFSFYIYLDGGVFILRDDFNSQQIPFSTALNGAGMWIWGRS